MWGLEAVVHSFAGAAAMPLTLILLAHWLAKQLLFKASQCFHSSFFLPSLFLAHRKNYFAAGGYDGPIFVSTDHL
jgi:hypothetical protein